MGQIKVFEKSKYLEENIGRVRHSNALKKPSKKPAVNEELQLFLNKL